MPTLATNPRAKFDYQILETYEAGLVLAGFEVKAVKNGRMALKGSYVTIKNEEVWLINAQITPYQPKNTPADYEPSRTRKLLLRKKELKQIFGRSKEPGVTIIPLKVYRRGGLIKLAIGIARGKKQFDKRETIKKRDLDRDIKRETE